MCLHDHPAGSSRTGAANLIIGAGADEEVPPVNFVCPGNVINGAVQISNTGPGVLSPAPSIAIERNAISGAVRLTGNQGPIVVSSDTIVGGLFALTMCSIWTTRARRA